LTTTTIFGVASTLAMTFAFAVPYYAPPVMVDISGYGTCSGNTIQVAKAWNWTQHPAPVEVESVPKDSPLFSAFLQRNSIVWSEDGGDMQGVTPVSFEKGVLTTKEDLWTSGTCHFTLDAVDILSLFESLGGAIVGLFVSDMHQVPSVILPPHIPQFLPGGSVKIMRNVPVSPLFFLSLSSSKICYFSQSRPGAREAIWASRDLQYCRSAKSIAPPGPSSPD
jgi:hypothetical protein